MSALLSHGSANEPGNCGPHAVGTDNEVRFDIDEAARSVADGRTANAPVRATDQSRKNVPVPNLGTSIPGCVDEHSIQHGSPGSV